MVGRRRRTSNSTVGTADETAVVQYATERLILRPAPPGKLEELTFRLIEATVYEQDGRTVANLYDIYLRGPFIVRGFLKIDESHDGELAARIKRTFTQGHIEIPSSATCCIGLGPGPEEILDDGTSIFAEIDGMVWATGEAGWFEINPSAEYAPTYRAMSRAALLYYRIRDVYEEGLRLKRKDRPKGTDVLWRAAAKVGDGSTLEDIVDQIEDQKVLFLTQFLKEPVIVVGQLEWSQTDLYKKLVSDNKDLFETLKKSMGPAPTVGLEGAKPPTSLKAEASSSSESQRPGLRAHAQPAAHITLPVGRGRKKSEEKPPSRKGSRATSENMDVDPPTAASGSQSQVNPNSSPDPFAVARAESFPFMLQIVRGMVDEEVAAGRKIHTLKMNTLKSHMHRLYSVPQHPASEEMIHFHAAQLLQQLDRPAVMDSPLWAWLEQAAANPQMPAHIHPDDMARRLVRRRPMAPRHSVAQNASRSLIDDDSGHSGTSAPEQPKKRIGRPPKNRDNDSPVSHDDPSTHPSRSDERPRRGRKSGKVSGLRLVSSRASKRYRSPAVEVDEASSPSSRPAKRSFRHSVDDDADETMMEDSVADATSQPGVEEEMEDDGESSSEDDDLEPVRIVVRAERLPSMTPTGPNGTWVCDQDDCGYIVRGANDPDGQDLIREHFSEHERQSERITLALTEGRGRHLPINHLLEKIKAMGEKHRDQDQVEIDDAIVPQPIKRRLLV